MGVVSLIMRRAIAPAVLCLCLSAAARDAGRFDGIAPTSLALPLSHLSVRTADGWRVWWRSTAAPDVWTDRDRTLATVVAWTRVARGAELSEFVVSGSGEAWRTRLIVVRIDPRIVRLSLDTAFTDYRPDWTIKRMPTTAVFAANAGQFNFTLPWGWVVLNGRQYMEAGKGSLSSAFVIDSAGSVHWVHDILHQPRPAHAAWAFQSYPTLLRDGQVPMELRQATSLLDVEHRDARFAIGEDAGGRIILALTRFDAAGETLGFIPFGLTTPEMSAVMGSLGARDAMMLDGGISAQLALRSDDGSVRRWRGVRSVPLAIIGTANR